MPKLTPLQWLIHAVAIAFFGFAVFALTRDYYIRHPVRAPASASAPSPHGAPGGSRSQAEPSVLEPTSAIPASVVQGDPVLLGQEADALFGAGRYTDAIPLYRRVLELDPGDIETYNDLGLALYYTGERAGALETLAKGTAAGPDFQRIWLTLGFVSLDAGDRTQARTALERARDLGPDNPVGQEAIRLLARASEDR